MKQEQYIGVHVLATLEIINEKQKKKKIKGTEIIFFFASRIQCNWYKDERLRTSKQ